LESATVIDTAWLCAGGIANSWGLKTLGITVFVSGYMYITLNAQDALNLVLDAQDDDGSYSEEPPNLGNLKRVPQHIIDRVGTENVDEMKGEGPGKKDLYYDREGWIWVVPKGGGDPYPMGENISWYYP
jgi:hypothetical protein